MPPQDSKICFHCREEIGIFAAVRLVPANNGQRLVDKQEISQHCKAKPKFEVLRSANVLIPQS